MRPIVSLVAASLVTFGSISTHAMCSSSAFWAWPDKTLPTNGHILITGYGMTQPTVRTVGRQRPVLVGGGQTVPLTVKALYEGQLRVTQVLLEPAHPLLPSTRYELRLERPTQGQLMVRTDGKRTLRAWTTGKKADAIVPKWKGPPLFTGGTYDNYGCGPSIHVDIKTPVVDPGDQLLVLATVTVVGRSRGRSYYVPITGGTVSLGHGMCSGPFRFGSGMAFEVSLTAVDAAGHTAPAPGDPVVVVGPQPR